MKLLTTAFVVPLLICRVVVCGEVGNGGDFLAAEFIARGYFVYEFLTETEQTLLSKEELERFRIALHDTALDMPELAPAGIPHKDVFGRDVPSVVEEDPARPGKKIIRVYRKWWKDGFEDKNERNLVQFVFHEYLRVIEKDDDQFKVSNQLKLTDDDYKASKYSLTEAGCLDIKSSLPRLHQIYRLFNFPACRSGELVVMHKWLIDHIENQAKRYDPKKPKGNNKISLEIGIAKASLLFVRDSTDLLSQNWRSENDPDNCLDPENPLHSLLQIYSLSRYSQCQDTELTFMRSVLIDHIKEQGTLFDQDDLLRVREGGTQIGVAKASLILVTRELEVRGIGGEENSRVGGGCLNSKHFTSELFQLLRLPNYSQCSAKELNWAFGELYKDITYYSGAYEYAQNTKQPEVVTEAHTRLSMSKASLHIVAKEMKAQNITARDGTLHIPSTPRIPVPQKNSPTRSTQVTNDPLHLRSDPLSHLRNDPLKHLRNPTGRRNLSIDPK